MTENFEFAPLVSSYLTDPRIQSAVDDLAGKTMAKGYDTEFSWDEFPEYVDAWLAAQQTVAEWCKTYSSLWEETWGFAVNGRFGYSDRAKSDDLLDVGGILECWWDNWSSRHIDIGNLTVGLIIYFDTTDLQLGIEFEAGSNKKHTKSSKNLLEEMGWEFEDDDTDQMWTRKVRIKKERSAIASIDLRELQQDAKQAIDALSTLAGKS